MILKTFSNCEQMMTSGLFENKVTNKLFAYKSYIYIYMCVCEYINKIWY